MLPPGDPRAGDVLTDGSGGLRVDGQNVGINIQETAGTITELGKAIAIQRIRERIMKVGQRYIDWVYGFFGKQSSTGRDNGSGDDWKL